MPRYYFHQEDGRSYPDEEGTQLESLDHARAVALQSFVEMMHHDGARFWNTGSWRMRVADQEGLTLFRLELNVLP